RVASSASRRPAEVAASAVQAPFFFSSRRRHTRFDCDWSSDVCSSDLWLFNGLTHSSARWNVIGQDVLMAQLRQRMPDGNFGYWTDNWDGYPASRTRLLQHISRSRTRNPRSEERRVGKECRTGL